MTFQLHHTTITGATPGTSTELCWYTTGPADAETRPGPTPFEVTEVLRTAALGLLAYRVELGDKSPRASPLPI